MNVENLEKLIEQKRKELIESGIKNGFTHKITVANSQQLDNLLNKLQQQPININK